MKKENNLVDEMRNKTSVDETGKIFVDETNLIKCVSTKEEDTVQDILY